MSNQFLFKKAMKEIFHLGFFQKCCFVGALPHRPWCLWVCLLAYKTRSQSKAGIFLLSCTLKLHPWACPQRKCGGGVGLEGESIWLPLASGVTDHLCFCLSHISLV